MLNIRRTSAEISSNSPVVHVGEEVCRLGGRLISSKRPAMSTRTTALSEEMGRGCLAGSLMRIFKYLRLGYLRVNGTVEPGVDRYGLIVDRICKAQVLRFSCLLVRGGRVSKSKSILSTEAGIWPMLRWLVSSKKYATAMS